LNNLASLYENQGRFADAKLLYKRSLEITQSVLGPDHVEIAPVLNNLALLYDREGRYTDADPLYKRLFAILEAVYGPNHPYVGKSVNNAAERLRAQGRYGDAEPLYKRSLAIAEKALGPEHPDVAASLGNLALLYNDQRRYTDAEPLFKRALAIWEKALGADYPKVGDSLNNLAMLYHSQGRFGDALPLVRNAAQKGFDRKGLHLAVLTGAIKNVLITRTEALNESFEVVQRTMSSAASTAINQLSMRFAAGNDELAQLVRRDQDLAAQNESLDKLLIAAIAKEPSKRDLLTEQRIRDRLKSISAERAEIGILFNQRFPNFAALSKPTPISVKDTQAVLSDDEALVVLDFGAKSYAWLITRTEADWIELGITAKELSDGVQTLRSSLTFDTDKPFDTQLASKSTKKYLERSRTSFKAKRVSRLSRMAH
jgi:tetratricopeptide (TPR) repeat protein